MEYSLINKYLSGNATEKEVEEIFQWIESSSDNKSEFIKYKKAWALTARSKKSIDAAWTKVQKQTTGKNNLRLLVQNTIKYAASFILILGLGMVLHYVLTEENTPHKLTYLNTTQIKAPLGQMTNVSLPDGTSIILNSGSTVSYNGYFAEGDRTVELIGEAYFDVVKDVEHPFTVKTQSVDLRVYGTSFNIEAYPEDKHVNTTLIEGSLGVMTKKGNELVRLIPGENASFNKLGSKLFVSKVDTSLYMSWKDGIISFRNERLEDIATKIERWYNVEIIIRNKKLADELYWGSILRNKPIDQILEVLKLTASFEYEMVTRTDQSTLIYWD